MFDCKFYLLKKYFYLLLLVVLGNEISGCDLNTHSNHNSVVFGDPVSYNEYITARQKELMDDVNMYFMASEHNYPLAVKMLDTLLLHSTQNLEDIRLLAPFKEDSSFKEIAIDLFSYYNKTFVPYSRNMMIIRMKIDSGTAVDSDYEIYNQYRGKIIRQLSPLEQRLVDIQARFAKKNNFRITNKLQTDE